MKRALGLAMVAALAAATPAAFAQDAAKPPAGAAKTYDMRDATAAEMAVWIKDPNVHAFYQATLDAFAQGAERLDRAAYVQRSREIFRALALAHGMNPKALQDHLKDIPDQMIQIVTRDPQTLASYDNFIVALFGPQAH